MLDLPPVDRGMLRELGLEASIVPDAYIVTITIEPEVGGAQLSIRVPVNREELLRPDYPSPMVAMLVRQYEDAVYGVKS